MKYCLALSALINLSACSSLSTWDDLTDTRVEGDRIYINGILNAQTLEEMTVLLDAHPEVTTLILEEVEGSIDDEYNLQTALFVHEAGLNTYLPRDGFIESGAVDLFCAGRERIMERGAHVGVHSWGGSLTQKGNKLDRDHPAHQDYVDYFSKVGCPVEFYWFTLDAADANDIHKMTEDELVRYKVVTRFID